MSPGLHDRLPADLPIPEDDGGAAHLTGTAMPRVTLPATDGSDVLLADLAGRTVVYAYPRTGEPGRANPDGWDAIPGARGCTPQSCAFRDHFGELKGLGVSHVFGLSTQTIAYQREMADRLHLPFAVLSDAEFVITQALSLPTFEAGGLRLMRRLTLVVDDGRITKVFYPVFPPDRSAGDVVEWLRAG